MDKSIQKDTAKITMPARKHLCSAKALLGLSNRKIAEATGVCNTTVSRYVNGEMDVSEEWAEKFCKIYQFDIGWFMSGEDDQPPVFTGDIDDSVTKNVSGAGKRLVEMRHKLGLVQKDVRVALGISHTAYSRIENGHVRLTKENAQKIEDEYGVGAEWLLYGDESKKDYPVGKRMIEWLWENKDEREKIWHLMRGERGQRGPGQQG